MTEAFAIADVADKLVVLCPYCHNYHTYETKSTPRLIEIDAMCDGTKKYKITDFLKTDKLFYAITLYKYEKERRRKNYHTKKTKKEEKTKE
jgi:hypothetical protein